MPIAKNHIGFMEILIRVTKPAKRNKSPSDLIESCEGSHRDHTCPFLSLNVSVATLLTACPRLFILLAAPDAREFGWA